jgi:hypothetical protein
MAAKVILMIGGTDPALTAALTAELRAGGHTVFDRANPTSAELDAHSKPDFWDSLYTATDAIASCGISDVGAQALQLFAMKPAGNVVHLCYDSKSEPAATRHAVVPVANRYATKEDANTAISL